MRKLVEDIKQIIEARIMTVSGGGKKYRIADLSGEQKVYFGRDEYVVEGIKREQVIVLKGKKGTKTSLETLLKRSLNSIIASSSSSSLLSSSFRFNSNV